jgi:DNA-binding CsgD family transcriptional regulator
LVHGSSVVALNQVWPTGYHRPAGAQQPIALGLSTWTFAGRLTRKPLINHENVVGLIAQLSNHGKLCELAKVTTLSLSNSIFKPVLVPQMDGRDPLHPVETDELIKRYKSGESVRQVASSLGIHRATVSSHLERRGIPRRAFIRSLTDEQCVDVARLYRSGMSMNQIGRQYGVHAKTVSNELRKLDVETRAGVRVSDRNVDS